MHRNESLGFGRGDAQRSPEELLSAMHRNESLGFGRGDSQRCSQESLLMSTMCRKESLAPGWRSSELQSEAFSTAPCDVGEVETECPLPESSQERDPELLDPFSTPLIRCSSFARACSIQARLTFASSCGLTQRTEA